MTGVGFPPVDVTREMGLPGPAEKTITPSLFHAPPRPSGASQIVWAGPPASATFFNLPGTKNPKKAPAGDQNGLGASSVPGTAWATSGLIGRTHKRLRLPS